MIRLNQAVYFEDYTSTSQGLKEIMFKEQQVFIPVPFISAPITGPIVDQYPIATPDNEPIEELDLKASDVVMDIPLRRS